MQSNLEGNNKSLKVLFFMVVLLCLGIWHLNVTLLFYLILVIKV